MFRIGERVHSERSSRRRPKNKATVVNAAPVSPFDVETLAKGIQRLSVDSRSPQHRPRRRASRIHKEDVWVSKQFSAATTPRPSSEEEAEWHLHVQFAVGKAGQKLQKRRHQKAPQAAVAADATTSLGAPDFTLPTNQSSQRWSREDSAGPSEPSKLEAELLKWCIRRCEQLKNAGNQALQLKSYAKARELYTEAIRLLEGNVSQTRQLMSKLLTNRAATFQYQSDLQGAISDCKKAREIYAKNLRAYTRAATCYTALGDFERAQSVLERALEMLNASDPQFSTLNDQLRLIQKLRSHMEAVESHSGDGDVDEGILNKVEFLFDHVYQCERVWRLAALTYLQARLFGKLDGILEEAQELFNVQEGEDPKQRCWWGWIRFEGVWWNSTQSIDTVLSELQNLIDQMKSHSLTELQTTRQREKLTLEAMEQLMKSLVEANGIKDQGNKAIAQKNYSQATEYYSQAIGLCELSGCPVAFLAVLYCNRGAASHGAGRYMEALGDVCIAQSLNPTYVKPYQRLTRMHLETYNHPAAKEILSSCEKHSLRMTQQEAESHRALKEAVRVAERSPCAIHAYKLMGLTQHCQVTDIKKVFKKLALKLHPDKASHSVKLSLSWMKNKPEFVEVLEKQIRDSLHDHMQHLFKELNSAHTILTDPADRRKLDRDLREAEEEARFRHFYTSPRGRPFQSDAFNTPWCF